MIIKHYISINFKLKNIDMEANLELPSKKCPQFNSILECPYKTFYRQLRQKRYKLTFILCLTMITCFNM